jgi:hypothetical protein
MLIFNAHDLADALSTCFSMHRFSAGRPVHFFLAETEKTALAIDTDFN